jgi:hypothetical protein
LFALIRRPAPVEHLLRSYYFGRLKSPLGEAILQFLTALYCLSLLLELFQPYQLPFSFATRLESFARIESLALSRYDRISSLQQDEYYPAQGFSASVENSADLLKTRTAAETAQSPL